MPSIDDEDEHIFKLNDVESVLTAMKPFEHIYADDIICETEDRGYPERTNKSLGQHDRSYGIIPFWAPNSVLRYRFNDASIEGYFENKHEAKAKLKSILEGALSNWGRAVPIRFTERPDLADFEIVMRSTNACNSNGQCKWASAFFPNMGQNRLTIYPHFIKASDGKFRSNEERLRVMAHEVGHIFGLRHWFANIQNPTAIFGTNSRFNTMDTRYKGGVTETDIQEVISLYSRLWDGRLKHINQTPVRFFRPYSSHGLNSEPSTLIA